MNIDTSQPATATAHRSALMLNGPLLATLLTLAVPNLVVMLAQAAANFMESYYVGLLGVDALAGAALVFPLVMLMQMMSSGGMGGGISSAIARALGAGRRDDAEALALHAIIVALALGLLSSLAVIFGGPLLYNVMGGRGPALDAALAYSNAVFGGAVFLWLLNALASILRGTGNMALPAAVLACGVLIMLVASPALIFGFGPLPSLGVRGAGLALVLYYAIGSTVLGTSLLSGRSGLHFSFRHRLRWTLFDEILRVGGPAILVNLNAYLAVVVATSMIAPLGAPALAGFGLGIRLEYLQIPIAFGFGTGMVAMIGMNVGAGQFARARRIAWTGACVAAITTEAVGLTAALFPRAWLGLFTNNLAAIDAGAHYLRIVAPAYGLFGLGLALYFSSQGARRMAWAVWAGFARVAVIAFAGGAAIHLMNDGLTMFLLVLVAAFAAFAAINAWPWMPRASDGS
jgi:putative MATE family efflux protein